MNNLFDMNRREWLSTTAGIMALGAGLPAVRAGEKKRLRVAAIITEFVHRSHAHVILENFLEPYLFNGQVVESGMDVVSMYVDQVPAGADTSRSVAMQYGIDIYPTIAEALRCGGKDLGVDAVLSIAEFGTYPYNEKAQLEYPRKRFFDEIVQVFRDSGRVVPLFNDKHLTYRWDWAAEMMSTVEELKIPFMAGSSVPLAQRRPPLELPKDARIEEAISIHGGGLESYDFHAMEVLQSMVEGRHGGETGVSEIQTLEGEAAWKAAEEGRWSVELAEVALRTELGEKIGSLKDHIEHSNGQQPRVMLIKYRDGLRGTVLALGNSATRWNFACRLAGEKKPLATHFYVGPWDNRNLFKALSHSIQEFIREKQSPYPVERTYLVTGMLAAAMDSRFEGHRRLATPHLEIAYQSRDFRAMREMGASWKIITEQTPEPTGFDTTGRELRDKKRKSG